MDRPPASAGTPASALPYREYSEVFFGGRYRVLRGGSWATEARVPRPRSATGIFPSAGRSSPASDSQRTDVMEPTLGGTPEVRSHLGPNEERTLADDVLDGLTQPFKELPPKHFYDARGSELFERSASCRSITRRVPSGDPRAHAEDIVARTGAVELVELGSGSATRPASCSTRCRAAGDARALHPGRRLRERRARRRRASPTSTRHAVHGVVGDFERHLGHLPPAAGPRLVPFLGGTIGNFPPGSRRRFLRSRAAARQRRASVARDRSRQGHARHRGRLRRPPA